MENSILILGAAALQIPLIKYVKSKGYNVIVVSIRGNYPGFEIADKCVYCDIRDVSAILDAVKDDDIKAVLTDETDIAVPAVAHLNNALGLVGNDPSVAEAYSNKYVMRQKCKEAGVSVPLFFHVSGKLEISKCCLDINFPAVMKPEDNQGSRGIYIVNNFDQIFEHFDDSISFSKSGKIIIEEYFKGKEFVVEGFVYNGEYLNFGIGERKYFDIEGLLIPCQTLFPSNLSEDCKLMLLDAERTLHAYMKPTFGMIHSEYLVNEETNEYILVETALRGGGVYISSHLVPFYSGLNNYDMLFKCALGNKISLREYESKKNLAASGYVCFTLPEGDVISVSGVKTLKQMDSVVQCDIDELTIGSHINKMINKTQRLGPIVLKAPNRMLLDSEIKKIKEILKIEVMTANGQVKNIVWN